MKSRVRHLKLNLLVHDDDRDAIGRIQQQVRQDFAVAVINAMEQALHSRFHPEVIVRVRQLSVRWSLALRQISDPDYSRMLGEELAGQLATGILQQSAANRLRPSAAQSVVLFENITHLRAARMSDESESKASAWIYDGFFAEHDPWTETCTAGAEEIKNVVSYLDRMGTLTPVLTGLDPVQVRHATAVLPPAEWPAAALRSMGVRAFNGRSPREAELHIPPLSPPSLQFDANELPSTRDFGRSRSELNQASPPDTPLPETGEAEGKLAEPGAGAPIAGPDRGGAEKDGRESEQEMLPPLSDGAVIRDNVVMAENIGRASPDVSMEQQGVPDVGPDPVFARLAGLMETRFGGLFYLLNPILELDLAEHLWCAGVKEGEFFCHVARLILGAEGASDPAPRILGGVQGDQDPALTPLPAWAEAEIRAKGLASLRSLLSRQASASFTENLEERIEKLAGELALPVQQEPPRSGDGPRSASLRGDGELGIGRKIGGSVRSRGVPPTGLHSGWIESGPEEIQIHLPLDSVDIGVRRAGLDFNPGYLPWLKRRVRLIFE